MKIFKNKINTNTNISIILDLVKPIIEKILFQTSKHNFSIKLFNKNNNFKKTFSLKRIFTASIVNIYNNNNTLKKIML